MEQHLRIARPTNHLSEMIRLYCEGLGLEKIGGFEDHDGYSGAMLGRPGAAYHLEFTQHEGEPVTHRPTRENLLVFYIPDREHWLKACRKAESAGFASVTSENPYWDERGRTFEDPEGYRVVLENEAWIRE